MKKWINVEEIGQLYLEKILVTFDIPILFVCSNGKNKKYLCLNIGDEDGTTVIAEISKATLSAMQQMRVPHRPVVMTLPHILLDLVKRNKKEILNILKDKNIEVLITLGAGDIDNYVPEIKKELEKMKKTSEVIEALKEAYAERKRIEKTLITLAW